MYQGQITISDWRGSKVLWEPKAAETKSYKPVGKNFRWQIILLILILADARNEE
jgi:hypothetical protein